MVTTTLVRVTAPHFVAGLIIEDGRCVECAPVLHKDCKWRTSEQLRAIFKLKGWKATIVTEEETGGQGHL